MSEEETRAFKERLESEWIEIRNSDIFQKICDPKAYQRTGDCHVCKREVKQKDGDKGVCHFCGKGTCKLCLCYKRYDPKDTVRKKRKLICEKCEKVYRNRIILKPFWEEKTRLEEENEELQR